MLTKYFEWIKGSMDTSAEEQLREKKMVHKLFWIDFIVCFLFFMPFIKLHFSIDSYTMMVSQNSAWGGGWSSFSKWTIYCCAYYGGCSFIRN